MRSATLTLTVALSVVLSVVLPAMAGTNYTVEANAVSGGAELARGPWVYSGNQFYGASQFGGANALGSIFRFDPSTGQYFLIHSFSGGNGGTMPSTGLVESPSNGRLYGTTYGGMNGAGTIYRIDKPGNFFEIIYQFVPLSGGNSDGIPMEGSDGKLYGVVSTGGLNSVGGIYRIDLDGANYQLMRAFTGTSGVTRGKGTGCFGLVEGTNGILYGATPTGGSSDVGVFFSMSKDGLSYNVFREWPTTGLRKPQNRLLLASDGFFYGSASEGGAANLGGIYRISADGDYTELHEFDNSLDGNFVSKQLTEGSDGYLYGCTFFSSNNMGSLFRLSKDGSSFAVLHRFTGGNSDGSQPDSQLIETTPGVFYGTVYANGAGGSGIVYRLETTIEAPTMKLRGPKRVTFRGRSLRLRGTAADDLSVERVEFTTKKLYKPAKGTTRWKARIPVKPTSSRVKVRLRALDDDGQLSGILTVRARRD